MFEVIVAGGGYAGMAAALQLVRARRQVLVVDAGRRRNRFASHSYGFIGQDGADPAQIAATARTQLLAYPTLRWIDGTVEAVTGQHDAFAVQLADGSTHVGRRLLLATGVADRLPDIPGLADRWGQSVFHCPYCHGYELDRGPVGVIATGPMSTHQAELLTEWGPATLLLNEAAPLTPDARDALQRRGVMVEETPIRQIEGAAAVILSDGRRLDFAGLFTAPRCVPASPVAETMGCAMMETPMGVQIRTNDAKETSIPGVFACGDVGRAPHSLSLAVGDGAWAGANLHRSLVWPWH